MKHLLSHCVHTSRFTEDVSDHLGGSISKETKKTQTQNGESLVMLGFLVFPHLIFRKRCGKYFS